MVKGLGKETPLRVQRAIAFFKARPHLDPNNFEAVHVVGEQPVLNDDEGLITGETHSHGRGEDSYTAYVMRKDVVETL